MNTNTLNKERELLIAQITDLSVSALKFSNAVLDTIRQKRWVSTVKEESLVNQDNRSVVTDEQNQALAGERVATFVINCCCLAIESGAPILVTLEASEPFAAHLAKRFFNFKQQQEILKHSILAAIEQILNDFEDNSSQKDSK